MARGKYILAALFALLALALPLAAEPIITSAEPVETGLLSLVDQTQDEVQIIYVGDEPAVVKAIYLEKGQATGPTHPKFLLTIDGRDVEVRSPVFGEVTGIFVKVGDRVSNNGEVLAAVTSDPIFLYRDAPGSNGIREVIYNWPEPAVVYSINQELSQGKSLFPHDELAVLNPAGRSKAKVDVVIGGKLVDYFLQTAETIHQGDILYTFIPDTVTHSSTKGSQIYKPLPGWGDLFGGLFESTGLYDIYRQTTADFPNTWILGLGRVLMMAVALVLLYLAIFKQFEPLLLLPIGFGALLANIPLAGISTPGGLLHYLYAAGIGSGIFPLLIFMGVGAMTDFGPLLANPKTALMGAAAQLGIFGALIGAVLLNVSGLVAFSLKDAASIGIIGGADGPTSIYLTSKLSPALLGAVAVAAYSYMALVPIIQPPIMRFFTNAKERKIKMKQLRPVSKLEKVCFPILITLLCAFLLPSAAPLIGMLMLGNLMRECGVVDRLSDTAQNALINIVTIFLGLSVGSKLSSDQFLSPETLGILVLGVIAFSLGTAGGIWFAKIYNLFSKDKINPLIGSAGVSAVPMAARVSNKVGLEYDPHNYLLMHAMGPNVAGVIGSAVAAGVLLQALG